MPPQKIEAVLTILWHAWPESDASKSWRMFVYFDRRKPSAECIEASPLHQCLLTRNASHALVYIVVGYASVSRHVVPRASANSSNVASVMSHIPVPAMWAGGHPSAEWNNSACSNAKIIQLLFIDTGMRYRAMPRLRSEQEGRFFQAAYRLYPVQPLPDWYLHIDPGIISKADRAPLNRRGVGLRGNNSAHHRMVLMRVNREQARVEIIRSRKPNRSQIHYEYDLKCGTRKSVSR